MGLLHRLRSDEALMLAFQRGDGGAFDVVYERHKNRLLRFVLGLGRSSGLTVTMAEELAQDTWLSIIDRIEQYSPSAKFTTYLFTVARNGWIDWFRKRQVRRDINVSLDVALGGELEEGSHVAASANSHVSPEGATMETHVEFQRLLLAIDLLPEVQREVYLMKEEGFSLKEIATCIQQPPETVKSRLRYARNRLRSTLDGISPNSSVGGEHEQN